MTYRHGNRLISRNARKARLKRLNQPTWIRLWPTNVGTLIRSLNTPPSFPLSSDTYGIKQ